MSSVGEMTALTQSDVIAQAIRDAQYDRKDAIAYAIEAGKAFAAGMMAHDAMYEAIKSGVKGD